MPKKKSKKANKSKASPRQLGPAIVLWEDKEGNLFEPQGDKLVPHLKKLWQYVGYDIEKRLQTADGMSMYYVRQYLPEEEQPKGFMG